jgi:hypothetical protein
MAIQHTIEKRDDYLLVKASGFDEDLMEVMQYGMSVLQAAVAENATHILADESELEYRLGITDTYEYASIVAEHAPRVWRIAFVMNPANEVEADFFSTAVKNRGVVIRMFKTFDDAETWLLSKES